MSVTTGQSVNNYASTKLCCIATNVVEADKDFKYGAKDAMCCIANNFVATTYLEMLQCNDYSKFPSGLKVLYSVSTFPDGNTAGGVNVNSATLGGVNLATPGAVLTTGVTTWGEVLDRYNILGNNFTPLSDQGVYYVNSSSTVNSDGNVVTTTYIYYDPNLLGSEPAYDATTSPATPVATYTLDYSLLVNDPSKYSCFTDEDVCNLKNWLDNYCDSCTKSYAAKAVTTTL